MGGRPSLQGTLVSMAMALVKPSHAPHEDGRRAGRRRARPFRRSGARRGPRPGATLQGELDRAGRVAVGDQAQRPLEGLGLRVVRGVREGRAATSVRRPQRSSQVRTASSSGARRPSSSETPSRSPSRAITPSTFSGAPRPARTRPKAPSRRSAVACSTRRRPWRRSRGPTGTSSSRSTTRSERSGMPRA